ncbi:N-acetyltransferase family protein [Ampullimonas aquatilis]|uniref:GNAT family N-acetyltransferase n=1 Tax=Ampullimonas aquatilis TaxID=1341549 RepID=UPI003C743401
MFDIRPANIADLPEIVAIYNATIPSRQVTSDLQPVTVDSRYAWFFAHPAHRRPIWIASPSEQPEVVAGWLSFSDFYGRPAYSITAEISMYVADAWRRQGLGQHFLNEAFRACPLLGIEQLVAFVFAHNPVSVGLFEKNGFQRWGHLPKVARLDENLADLLILGKAIELAS